MINRPIILASKSPRRQHLLQEAGFEFEVRTRSIEENFPAEMPAVEVAEYLARLKADAVKDWIIDQEIIITADSVVILEDKIYGKPQDAADAKRILRELSGKVHQVITGVCIMTKEQTISFSDVANVHFAELTDAEIEYYIEKYKPFDKAGSYGVQEWIGFTKVQKIEGTFANIMGLPIQQVYDELIKFM